MADLYSDSAGGSAFVSGLAVTAGSGLAVSVAAGLAYLPVSPVPFRNMGSWMNSQTYAVSDLVFKDTSKIYFCVLANTGQAPPNATYWAPLITPSDVTGNGSRFQHTGASTLPVPASTTTYVDFAGSHFVISSNAGGPLTGYTRLASVTTNGTSVTGVTDLRSQSNPTGSLTVLSGNTVGTTQVSVAHGLGYAPSQVVITMTSVGAIYRSAASDATNVYLKADSAGRTCDLYVR